jgi:predicted PurR-regulated permease PerM
MEKIRTQLQGFVEEKLNIPVKEQDQKLREKAKNMEAKVGDFAKKFVAGVFGAIAGFALTMVFTCLFLFQREKYKTFVLKLYKGDNVIALEKVLTSISKVSQKYLTGMSYSIMILTTLYTVGFLIIGLQNAFLLAFIAAVMVIIPYVGAWIGGLVPFSMALITGDSGMAFSVAAVLVGVQLVDNNFIEPYVVGGEVRLSFAATMVALLTGGALWGIAGVVLFVPLMGILRIIFDHIEPMQPYGFLIGDQKPPPSKGMSSLFRNVMFRRRR